MRHAVAHWTHRDRAAPFTFRRQVLRLPDRARHGSGQGRIATDRLSPQGRPSETDVLVTVALITAFLESPAR